MTIFQPAPQVVLMHPSSRLSRAAGRRHIRRFWSSRLLDDQAGRTLLHMKHGCIRR